MSDFDKVINESIGNIKSADEIINKRVLNSLIEDNEELYKFLSATDEFSELRCYRQTVANTIRNLLKLRQKLGYED